VIGADKAEALGAFVRQSVTNSTMTKYRYGWRDWCEYVNLQGRSDYYMKSASRHSKVRQVVNFFRERYGRRLREKQATEVGAAIRKYFEAALQDTEWLDDPQIKIARRACRRSALENRVCKIKSRAGQEAYMVRVVDSYERGVLGRKGL
jgi:hypothetical protein